MENFLRLSVKINNILCILIVLLSGLSYLVDMRRDKDVASWGIGVSLTFCVFLIILSLIAKRGLTLMIREDDQIKAYKVMRAGIVFAGCLMAFFILGLAIGISTGMVSYLYILLILATGFYLFCMLKVRPPKPDVLGGGEGKEYAEPLLDVIHEIPDTEFFEEGSGPYDYDTESVVKEYHLPEETHDFKELHGFGNIEEAAADDLDEPENGGDAGQAENIAEHNKPEDVPEVTESADAALTEEISSFDETETVSDIEETKDDESVKSSKPARSAKATKSAKPAKSTKSAKAAKPAKASTSIKKPVDDKEKQAEEEQLVMNFSNAKSKPNDFIAQYDQLRTFDKEPSADPADPKAGKRQEDRTNDKD